MARETRRQRKRRIRAWSQSVPDAETEPREPIQALPSAVREYAEQVLTEPPPVTPTAAYSSPDPPSWMVSPVAVHDGQGRALSWVDEAPLQAWELRRGKAAYELLREEQREALRHADSPTPKAWGSYREEHPLAHTNGYINHLTMRKTAQQRERLGWTMPWNRTAPPKKADDLEEAECDWQPWAYDD